MKEIKGVKTTRYMSDSTMKMIEETCGMKYDSTQIIKREEMLDLYTVDIRGYSCDFYNGILYVPFTYMDDDDYRVCDIFVGEKGR